MPITGGIKIFKRSKSLGSDGVTVTATSGDASSDRCLDRNDVSYWRSVDSNDTVTETLEITFTEAITLSRLLLVDHNWKGFNVKYFSGGMYVHFAGVVGINGALSNITETAFADDTAYYEFTPVTTTKIQIEVTTTQTANQEKYLNQLIATEELGTLQGFPDIANNTLSRNSRQSKTLSGRISTQKGERSFACEIRFENYPPSLSADIDLIFQLWDSEDPFIFWACGGRRGSPYFRKQLRSFRLRDVFNCDIGEKIDPDYTKNVYTLPVNFSVKIMESVD